MPVLLQSTRPPKDCKDLYLFLQACKEMAEAKSSFHLASFSFPILEQDPLAILHSLTTAPDDQFYFEYQDIAIAAFGSVLGWESQGQDSFQSAKRFVQEAWSNTTAIGPLDLPFSGPHYLGGFTFFEPGSRLFLPACQVTRHPDHTVAVVNVKVDPDTDAVQLTDRVWHQYQRLLTPPPPLPFLDLVSRNGHFRPSHPDIAPFRTRVLAALDLIRAQRIRKIVLAHALDRLQPQPFQVLPSLLRLRQLYPDCALFWLGHPQGRHFIGASPEQLLNLHQQELSTIALAGSAPRGQTPREDAILAQQLRHSQKDRHEHQLVVDFIVERLRHMGVNVTDPTDPHLLQLSNIQHLQTRIQGAVPTHLHLLDLLAELHPTAAVAGIPRHLACSFIRQFEDFDRGYYAAPIGWLDYQGNGQFVVGIRSALLEGSQARLFAGAGIVEGSDPDREVAEVQLKFQALLQSLG